MFVLRKYLSLFKMSKYAYRGETLLAKVADGKLVSVRHQVVYLQATHMEFFQMIH